MSSNNMYFKIICTLFLVTNACSGLKNDSLKEKIDKLRHKYLQLYGNINNTTITKESLDFPGENKAKLSAISSRWVLYYECVRRHRDSLRHGRMTSRAVAAYAGSVARLHCDLCISPVEGATWMIAESPENLTFTPLEERETTVFERDGSISVYHVQSYDAGVYRCDVDHSHGGLIFLEVLDDDHPYVVTELNFKDLPFRPLLVKHLNVIVYTQWGKWSRCSTCGQVGRKRRYGLCTVIYFFKPNNNYTTPVTSEEENIFQVFPAGIPCRSPLLPTSIRDLAQVERRPNEVITALCKVPCSGNEYDDNAPGRCVTPRHDILFAQVGAPLVLRCPGTSLRDCPVSWRAGGRHVSPRSVDVRDHVLIHAVTYRNTDLYSCWECGVLSGTVRLCAWRGGLSKKYTVLVAGTLVAALLLAALRHFTRHY